MNLGIRRTENDDFRNILIDASEKSGTTDGLAFAIREQVADATIIELESDRELRHLFFLLAV